MRTSLRRDRIRVRRFLGFHKELNMSSKSKTFTLSKTDFKGAFLRINYAF